MKRILTFVLITLLLVFSFCASPTQKAFAASIQDNSVIILSGNVNDQNKVVINANLTVNTGISAMTLELSYNKYAMTLSNVDFGPALSSLSPMTTNTDTSEGYSITPFKFNYSGNENDFSTGKLFTLTFDLLESIGDGTYEISLEYKKNRDVNYIDYNDEVRTKNLYIDRAEIKIKNNSVTDISSVSEEIPNSTIWVVLIVISSITIATCGTLVAIKFFKRKRNWKKL